MAYNVESIDTQAARVGATYPLSGRLLTVLRAPAALRLQIALENGAAIPVREGDVITSANGFQTIRLWHDAHKAGITLFASEGAEAVTRPAAAPGVDVVPFSYSVEAGDSRRILAVTGGTARVLGLSLQVDAATSVQVLDDYYPDKVIGRASLVDTDRPVVMSWEDGYVLSPDAYGVSAVSLDNLVSEATFSGWITYRHEHA